ncbi:FAD-dependent oxidoreductase (plasmid) [Cereibacter sphaeroides f. sp. denitrificans]
MSAPIPRARWGLGYVPEGERHAALLAADWVHLGTHSAPELVRALVRDGARFSVDVSTHHDLLDLQGVPLVFASGPEDPAEPVEPLLARFRARGAQATVVTCGSRGAFLDAGGTVTPVRARRVEVVDTCGAGDSFIARFIALWAIERRPDAESLRGAADAATNTCLHEGGFQAGEADRLRPVGADEIRSRTGSGASYMGVVEPRAGTVQPAKLALGLRALALSRGVAIHERSPVSEIVSGRPCRLRTPGGTLQAGKVVIASNAWAAALPELARYLYVVDSQIVATEPVAETLDRLGWTGGESICDAQAHVLYYQRTKGGRVVFGRGSGNVAYGNRFGAAFNRRPDGGADNLRELHRVYPELRGARIVADWSGPIDCSAAHLPVFGSLTGEPDILFGVGFNGTGIAQTPVAGRILASLVLGRDDRWSRSGLVGLGRRQRLPPEPVRSLGARLVRRAIRIRNDLEIENRSPGPLVRWLSSLTPGR